MKTVERALLVLLAAVSAVHCNESFHEELLIAPLASTDLMSHFRFTTVVPLVASQMRDFGLLSRFVGELRDAHQLEELSVSLSRGVWDEERWGYSPNNNPTGAEVRARFGPRVDDVWAEWSSLTNALSGQLCASLNFLDTTASVTPKYTYSPLGVVNVSTADGGGGGFVRGTLPGENVCTENLTPWKKMLPCEAKQGLATLLNAASVHRTKYHALGLQLRKVCPKGVESCSNPDLEFTQTLTLVSDPNLFPDNVDRSRPVSWSIRTLFGIGLTSTCPMAESSRIYFETTRDVFKLQPPPTETKQFQQVSRTVAVYDLGRLLDEGVTNIVASYNKPTVFGIIPKPDLHAARYVTGHGQEKGGIVTKIVNNSPKPLTIVFLDVIPWYLRCYLHSLTIKNSRGRTLEPLRTEFLPGRARQRPYMLELVLKLPAKSETKISISFEKSLLKWLEYPPDANHGFYVGSAVISAILPNWRNATSGLDRQFSTFYDAFSYNGGESDARPHFYQLYTETLLINLPTPDFSMPYNVICLACTVVALAFGPMYNITTKRLVKISGEEEQEAGLLQRIKRKLGFGKTDRSEERKEGEPTEGQ